MQAVLPPLFSLLILGASALLSGCVDSQAETAPPAPPAPQVAVQTVHVSPVRHWQEYTGRLEATDVVELRPRVGGYVESLHFEEGSRVNKGDLLFRIDPRPFEAEVDRLDAEHRRAEAQLELARANRSRGKRLLEQHAISQEEYDRLATAESSAQADVEAVEAALRAARLDLGFTRVTAPITGRVSRALVTEGNLVDPSVLLTTIVSDDPVYAYFDVDEQSYLDYVAGAESGDAAPDVYMGLINEDGFPHSGRLDFVDNQVDGNSGTIRLRAVFDNAGGRFTPGLFARLRVVSRQSYPAALIEERAISADLDRRYVLVVDEKNVAQYRPVETGPALGELRVVRSGLAEGDRIIVSGIQRVRPGMPVEPVEEAAEHDRAVVSRLLTGTRAHSSAGGI
jgi:RND family efflux transporter MFP subunit